jgi:hypothetical protein
MGLQNRGVKNSKKNKPPNTTKLVFNHPKNSLYVVCCYVTIKVEKWFIKTEGGAPIAL